MEENTDVSIKSVSKKFGNVTAVDNFSLEVPHGIFTTLLGPSGCGKTTLLRMIAGFLPEDSGDIFICGKSQKKVPPELRTVGIVFQDYALFTHMTVRQNIEYGLRVRKIPAAERARLVDEIAETLGLRNELGRFPHELSGGQQQRVALGRVLVLKPKILLMDEPLSNLDAKLRDIVRDELKSLQKYLGITTIYVTHDQSEALSLSDQIAVLNGGRLEQCGTPREIYEKPATKFVADFVGEANFLHSATGDEFVARPEWLALATEKPVGEQIYAECRIVSESYFGREVLYRLETLGTSDKNLAAACACSLAFPKQLIMAAPVGYGLDSKLIEENKKVFVVVDKMTKI